MRFVVMSLLASCSFSPPQLTGDGGDAPDGSPDFDTDGDGVVDASDNCLTTKNPEQWNEDGDAFGDVCDLCPHIMADQADGDGDEIGDDCDPRPGTAGDQLVLFEGFNVPGDLPAPWITLQSGNWTIADGALKFTVTINNAGYALWPLPAVGDHTIQTFATTGSTFNTIKDIGIIFNSTANLSSFLHCSMSVYETLSRLTRYSAGWSEVGSGTAPVTGSYTMTAHGQTNQQACRVNMTATSGPTPSMNGTHVGLRSLNVLTTFPYFVVYSSP